MSNQEPKNSSTPSPEFTTTNWSVVLQAGRPDSAESMEALEKLCRRYWFPLYGYVRRKGHEPADAQDLTQEFFSRFLEKRYFSLADERLGKFRSFLLTSLKHFLINEWAKDQSVRRGGENKVVFLNGQEAEKRYVTEIADELSPDKVYEKRWAVALLESVLERLGEEYAASGRSAQFQLLKHFVWGERSGFSYEEIGQQAGMSEGAVKVAVHRLRQRYRELLRAQVAQTVSKEEEIDEELRHLILTAG